MLTIGFTGTCFPGLELPPVFRHSEMFSTCRAKGMFLGRMEVPTGDLEEFKDSEVRVQRQAVPLPYQCGEGPCPQLPLL